MFAAYVIFAVVVSVMILLFIHTSAKSSAEELERTCKTIEGMFLRSEE